MPSLAEFLGTWSLDPTSLVFALALAGLYVGLQVRLGRKGHRWSVVRAIAFVGLGLGLYLWVNLGFFGTYRYELRWAFTTRIAILLFGVPLLMSLGRPLELARAALGERGRRRLHAFMRSRGVRLVSNAVFAPLFALALFMIFITPLAGSYRFSPLAQNLTSVMAVLVGLLMVLPITSRGHNRGEIFVVAEFMLAFAELMLDAIPGVVLSINNVILDHAPAVVGALPAWFPSALDDQHFSGNLLWMIAEAADIPILVMLFIRWSRTDRKAAKSIDDLTDEQFEELAQAHLRVRG